MADPHAILNERRSDGDGRGAAGSSRSSGILRRCTAAATTHVERQRKNQGQEEQQELGGDPKSPAHPTEAESAAREKSISRER